MQNPLALIAVPLLLAISVSAADKSFKVTVEAGEFDRRDVIVEFTTPPLVPEGPFSLRRNKERVPFQVGPGRSGMFMIRELRKGQKAVYQLTADRGAPFLDGLNGHIENWPLLDQNGKTAFGFQQGLSSYTWPPLFAYQTVPGDLPRPDIKPTFRRGGYLHPIFTPSRKLVTDDFPANHVHHHGVWWAWTNTEFDGRKPDFWNMGDGKGRVEFVELGDTWSGPVHGGFRARHRFVISPQRSPSRLSMRRGT